MQGRVTFFLSWLVITMVLTASPAVFAADAKQLLIPGANVQEAEAEPAADVSKGKTPASDSGAVKSAGAAATGKQEAAATANVAGPVPIVVEVIAPQPKPPAAPPAPKPVSTEDLKIPVEELKILLKPLSTDELKIELTAWFDALHGKAKEVAEKELATARLNAKQKSITEQLESLGMVGKAPPESTEKSEGDSESASEEITDEQRLEQAGAVLNKLGVKQEKAAADSSVAELSAALEGQSAGLTKDKEVLIEEASKLRDQRTALADRVNTVFDAVNVTAGLKEDGTDNEIVAPYRLYVNSVAGINIDLSDTESSMKAVEKWVSSEEGGQRWLKNIAIFLATLVAFWFLSIILSALTRRALRVLRNPSILLSNFLSGLVRKSVMLIGLLIALAALEINISPLLAALGAIGFILAFALQGTISNFASGLLIMLYRPFDVGDSIDAGGTSGTVQSMTLVSTHITTPDNQNMIVPNNTIWGGIITNSSNSKNRRIDLSFTVPNDKDTDKIEATLEGIVNTHPKVLKDPAPLVRLDALVEDGIQFVVRPWVLTADSSEVQWDITREVKRQFDLHDLNASPADDE